MEASLPFDGSLCPITIPALPSDIDLGTYSFRNDPDTLLAQEGVDISGVATVVALADRREDDETDCEVDIFLELVV